jgi:hypothetical protein
MTLKSFALIALTVISFTGASRALAADLFDPAYVQGHLTVGKTTKDQVLQSFGQPSSKRSKLSSAGGATETLTYTQGGGSTKKKAGGFGRMVSSVMGVASDVTEFTGRNIKYDDRVRASKAKSQADAVDRLSGRGGAMSEADTSGGSAILSIHLTNGVVTSYDMQ